VTTVRVLGCAGAISAGNRTTAFLLGSSVLVDAGTGVGDLPLDGLLAIDDVLLTHAHLDHVAALPLMADAVMRRRLAQGRPPIRVHALPETLDALTRHLFNGVIWPDFTRLPTPAQPVLQLLALQVGDRRRLGPLTVEALPAHHTVPAVGYAVWPGDPDRTACWVFTGDTGPHPALWDRLATCDVAQLVIETAFGDDDHQLAEHSRHLHPRLLATQLQRLASPAQLLVTHVKPGDAEVIEQDFARLGLRGRLQLLRGGETLPLGQTADAA
jgi:ribonuclease BN (tRNA processing enzyme)